MKNVDVVKLFVAGVEKGKTTNVRIEGSHEEARLMNYNTCLAQRVVKDAKVTYIVNNTKYSRSTSAIQKMIENQIPFSMIEDIVIDVPMNTRSLK